MKTIAVSGGFDPIHCGHVKMILSAFIHGRVVVILNSDTWLLRKKGYIFQPWADRACILKNLWPVDTVVPVNDDNGTVGDALRDLRPDFFGKGGDRTAHNVPEIPLCEELGIGVIFGLGGDKVTSSQALVESASRRLSQMEVDRTHIRQAWEGV